MTIYTLMNKVSTLGVYVKLAAKSYKENKRYYSDFEEGAVASLSTLLNVDYITTEQFTELSEQLYHVFRMYKRH